MNESNMFTIIKNKNLVNIHFFKIEHIYMHYTQNENVHMSMLFPNSEPNYNIHVFN